MSDRPSERETGFAEGVLSQRLAQYDKHFESINGSVEKTAVELSKLVISVNELAAAQREATNLAEAVAAALERKEDAREKVELRKESAALTTRGAVAWAVGLMMAAFAIAGGVKAWLGL